MCSVCKYQKTLSQERTVCACVHFTMYALQNYLSVINILALVFNA